MYCDFGFGFESCFAHIYSESLAQLAFDGHHFRQILHLAFQSDPASPTFMGIFQKVVRADGSERFERLKQCNIFSLSWVSSNVGEITMCPSLFYSRDAQFTVRSRQIYCDQTNTETRLTASRWAEIKEAVSQTSEFFHNILHCSLPVCSLGCCRDSRLALSGLLQYLN